MAEGAGLGAMIRMDDKWWAAFSGEEKAFDLLCGFMSGFEMRKEEERTFVAAPSLALDDDPDHQREALQSFTKRANALLVLSDPFINQFNHLEQSIARVLTDDIGT